MPTPAQSQTTKVSIAATGDFVAAVAGQCVYCYDGMLVAANSVTLDIQDGTTTLAGVMSLIAGVPLYLEPRADGMPIFTTTAGAALHAVLGSGVQISGYLRTFQG